MSGTARNALLKKPSVRFAAAFVAATLLLSLPFRNAAAEQAAAPALTVSLAAPELRSWPETVPASGWLKSWQDAIIASETSGLRITDVLVDVGSVVKKGQTLARLSQDSVLAELRKQEAAVATAKASLAKATANADRARQLRTSGALSAEKITEYFADEQTATASLASEEAALDSEKIKLGQTTITAVDDGLITSRSADLGAVVSTGTELFRMVRQQRVEWQAEVSARYLPSISEGLKAIINGPDGRRIEGRVRLVGPSVSTDTSRAIIYVALPTDMQPRIGFYVTGSIELRTTPAVTVPETAIVFRDGLNYVFTVGDDSRVRRVRVETGRRNNGEVEIVSGLDRSAKVVTSGGAFLSDNDLVKVAETN
ncbi:efflux RND transporter periplasmic adaptor subunit [Rhizobium multihospitium]|uniref:efflux RND transporter periplasmic adaptor subunit n=1 Tax=Rhizobium multihospitium TaxID=410764 RepID=UPI001ABFF400|nr:efflux RND transporter periplasmic adaptor subunit [Rhizobium multihospitium]